MAEIKAGFSFLGGAVSDIFGALGEKKAAKGYKQAAKITRQNAVLTGYAGEINNTRIRREAYKIIGGQGADIAASGFSLGGSGLDIMRSSAQEAALDLAISMTQTNIDRNALESEAIAYDAEAAAANSRSTGGLISGIIGGIGAAVSIFSDRRLKWGIKAVGKLDNGLTVYRFRYIGSNKWWIGLIADEVMEVRPDAVTRDKSGFLMVDYSKAVI